MKRSNIIIAVLFHVLIIVPLIFFASHEGMLGKKMQTLSVTIMPKPKVEEAKPKVEQPRVENPKVALPTEQPKSVPQTVQTPLPTAAPATAPPPSVMPAIDFSDGAKKVNTVTDPIRLYSALIESQFRSQWNIPQSDYETLVEINITQKGEVSSIAIVSNNGDKDWTKSVNDALSKVKSLSRPPPKGFPNHFQIKFDTAEGF
jgi:outer membrane biosynthesis protein TonB